MINDQLRVKYLSQARFNRYLIATNHDGVRSNKLYKANIDLSKAFHPLLSQFEIVLRNSLHSCLSDHFKDEQWLINQKEGFMNDPSLANGKYFLKKSQYKVESDCARYSIPVTADHVIAKHYFGFWTSLYSSPHYKLLSGKPFGVFQNKPLDVNRTKVNSLLQKIKNLRNRINHCEPICFKGHNVDCNKVIQVRKDLYSLVNWIDPKLVTFFREIDEVQSKKDRLMNI